MLVRFSRGYFAFVWLGNALAMRSMLYYYHAHFCPSFSVAELLLTKFVHSGEVSDNPQSMKVRDWRHKIQKTFLSPKLEPKAEVRNFSVYPYFLELASSVFHGYSG